MDLTSETLTTLALRLPPADRARIAEALLTSLEGTDVDLDAEWLAEAERRDAALEHDPSSGRGARAVFAAARSALDETPEDADREPRGDG